MKIVSVSVSGVHTGRNESPVPVQHRAEPQDRGQALHFPLEETLQSESRARR